MARRGIGRMRAGGSFYATSNVVDLFIVAGQSNALGIGDSTLAPRTPGGLFITGSTIAAMLPPQGGENTASAWQAFSNEWARRTARKSAFVYRGVVGSSLVAAGTGWNPTGTLRAAAVTAANSAITAINGSGTYTLGSVYFLWLQGEQEAITYDGVTISASTYTTALSDLADYFKAQVPSMVKMGVIQILGTGTSSAITNQAALHQAFELIRSAQTAAVALNANLTMLYDGSHHHLALGGLSDGTHYRQATYNNVGKMAARQLASPRAASNPGLSSPVAVTTFADTFATKSSKTNSHTTNSATTCLIVAVSTSFPATNVAGAPSCTFNGVAMRAAAKTNVGSSAPSGNATAAIFILDSTLYGNSLGSVTGDIVVTCANNQRLIDVCAIEMTGVAAFVDTEGGDFPAPASPGATGSSVAIPATYYQTIVIACGAAIAASATPLTWAATNLTKAMDHGAGDGTNSSQTAVGYTVENTAYTTAKTYTATYSANCTHRAMAVIALRAPLDEETY